MHGRIKGLRIRGLTSPFSGEKGRLARLGRMRERPVFRSTLRSRAATEDRSLGEGRREP